VFRNRTIKKLKEYFELQELVSRRVFDKYGEYCWNIFPTKSLKMLYKVRKFAGVSLYINTWNFAGNKEQSGFRSIWELIGAVLSGHRFAECYDIKLNPDGCGKLEHELLWDKLYRNHRKLGITELESKEATVKGERGNWIHISCRYNGKGFRVIRP
jgi:hypothetical protein